MRFWCAVIFFVVYSACASANELATVRVGAAVSSELSPDVLHSAADSGDWLRQQPGVDGVRMGGHGIDPVIRGQSQNRLNILLDDSFVYGGCPNRMDPPTAYAPLHSYDEIEIRKGITSLQDGPGGSGGTVLFRRVTPVFLENDAPVRGDFGGRYGSNGDSREAWTNLIVGNEDGYLRTFGQYGKANNYEDGDGREIASGYEIRQGGVILGWTPNADSEWSVQYEETRERDVQFAGAGMDSPRSDSTTVALKGRHRMSSRWTLSGNVSWNQVDHLMDNFSLRPAPIQMGSAMKVEVPSESETLTAKLMAESVSGPTEIAFGLNAQRNRRDAVLRNVSSSPVLELARLWPDVMIRHLGGFAEVTQHFSDQQRLSGGVRIDHAVARPRDSNERPAGPPWVRSAAQLYEQAYGVRGDLEVREWLPAAFLRFELDQQGHHWFASASYSERLGDASELYIARNAAMGNQQWIGNPDLAPEAHRQLDIGLRSQASRWDSQLTLFADDVEDYIYREQVQIGTIKRDRYRNIRASLYGLEWEGGVRYASHWETRAQALIMRGDNRSDGGTLAQVSPYQGQLSQHWRPGKWDASITLRLAAANDRLNEDAGEQASAGYAVVDLGLMWMVSQNAEIALGMDNLFDKRYVNFINRNRAASDPLNIGEDSFTDTLTEPGRNAWISASYRF